jgi:hypothetical protein
MNYLERSISDTGFTKLSSVGSVVAAPFKGVANMYNSVGDDGKRYMGLGGGGFVLGTMAAPYAGQAITNITGHRSRMGGMRAKPINLGNVPGTKIPIGQIKTKSTLRGRMLGGKRLAGTLVGGKLVYDYMKGLDKGSIDKKDLIQAGAFSGIGAAAGMGWTKTPIRNMRFKPTMKRGLKGALLAAVPSVMYHYYQNKV